MASVADAEFRTPAASPPAPARAVAMDSLRAFVVVLVVIHHSLLAYMGGVPTEMHHFAGGAMIWRAFPVVDPTHWGAVALITGFNDVYFMSLMFFLSGLFVLDGLRRKGALVFLRDRLLRLGIPFLFSACVITPIAYYAGYLERGNAPGFVAYAQAWRDIGYWPTGPAWFVLLLLIFDVAAAALFAIAPRWGDAIGSLAKNAGAKPGRFFWLVVLVTLLAYAPLAHAFGPASWTYVGFLQFQSSRPLLYFVYFLLGAGIGARGVQSGLLAADGKLARRWPLWVGAMIAAFVLGLALLIAILTSKEPARQTLIEIGSLTFVLNCAASIFALLALFTRFAQHAGAIWTSLAQNSYGIYLVHYAVVAWLQFTLLTAPLPAPAKALGVIVAAVLLSWLIASTLRRIGFVRRLV
jgi:peptidoglycan/LPS O-acetylase OafA/YrhL